VKPWAVFLIPISTLRAGSRTGSLRDRLAGPALSIAVAAALWGPILITSTDALDGLRPAVAVAPDSVVQLLGLGGGGLSGVARTLQLVLAIAAAWFAVAKGRPAGVLLAGVSVRLMLDGGTWEYYTPAFVVGALMWDLFESRRRIPWATIAASVLLAPAWVGLPTDVRAVLRLVACSAALATVLLTMPTAPSRHRRAFHHATVSSNLGA
jgi:hypothetical protein